MGLEKSTSGMRYGWIDYSFRGKRRRESSGSTLKGDATKLLRKRTAEMGKGRIIGPDAESLSYEDLETIIRDNYVKNERRSTERLEASLKALRSFFGGTMALALDQHQLGPGQRVHRARTHRSSSVAGLLRTDYPRVV